MIEQLAGYAAFGIYIFIILAGGALAIFSKNLVRSLVGLIVTLFGVAGMYLLMAAPFMALMQIMIYVGAVSVLIFFAIMLTKTDCEAKFDIKRLLKSAVPAGIAAATMVLTIARSRINFTLPQEVSLKVIGKALLTTYMLPFELISIVLFVAMAGAVALGFERRREKE
ncbi:MULTISPECIES: NADH-quinone oxidoreductase subunit J family protein [unclassified Desulfurobacterium]|uniref:NADH-quinone oxidoreductase subunit J family protein n=1 Tax=Desulfurobacterium sp. TC5-1 TaxID=1158318 RepID=UPI0003B4E89D|nr:NADH-quinone oxidoreductase subunit J [Desulfurobacterium sp. TC5-1]